MRSRKAVQPRRESVEDMSDAEFDAFYEKVRRGEAHL